MEWGWEGANRQNRQKQGTLGEASPDGIAEAGFGEGDGPARQFSLNVDGCSREVKVFWPTDLLSECKAENRFLLTWGGQIRV